MQYRGSSRKRTPSGREKGVRNRPFYRYGGHIEFIRCKEYYGMPRGALAQYLRALLGQKRTSLYISREKTIIISSKHGATIFFPITIFFYENLKKNWPEKRA